MLWRLDGIADVKMPGMLAHSGHRFYLEIVF